MNVYAPHQLNEKEPIVIRIVADERKKTSGVPDHSKKMNVKVEFKMLDVADYIFSECAVERKGAREFVSSLFSGRLFDQANRNKVAQPNT